MKIRQTGVTMIGWVMILMLVTSGITLSLKLIPHYIDYKTIVTVVEALPTNVHEMSKGEIRKAIDKRFNINNIRELKSKQIITIERIKGKTNLRLAYERRENLLANVDIVLTFGKVFEFT